MNSSASVEHVLSRLAEELDIEVTPAWLEKWETYYRLLTEWNERVNLTSITDRESVYIKHFIDSMLLLRCPQFARTGNFIDVGTGAGFPGAVLALCCPALHVVLLDSLQKRLFFLREIGKVLQLQNMESIHARAEEGGRRKEWRESFGQAGARAVARLNVLAEYCLPFVKVGGYFFALKGPDVREELREAKYALGMLGGQVEDVMHYALPGGHGMRTIVVVFKKRPTPPAYPRRPGIPEKKPLGT
jgi:16S rRNA (guanine527-N7)-methyltransferase